MLRYFTRSCRPTALKAISRTPVAASASLSGPKILIGCPAKGQIAPVSVTWTDVIGDEFGVFSKRLASGRILSMLDMCASRAASCVVNSVTQKTGVPYSICTVGVTGTTFATPILHNDAVCMRGTVVHCGESSMGIYIRFFRQSPSIRTESYAGESFFTMVAITQDLQPAKVVPAMELTDAMDMEMHKRYGYIRSTEKKNAEEIKNIFERTVTPEEVNCPINKSKPLHVPISTTHCSANRIFFSAHLNKNKTIFGGELMAWMERHAVHCGCMFTGNRHVFTVGMHNLSFDQPVFDTDWVSLDANVIYVRNSTMEVDVKLTAERRNGSVITNRASFLLINNNDIGQKVSIPVGLDLSLASQEDLKRYMIAKLRYQRRFNQTKTAKQAECYTLIQ